MVHGTKFRKGLALVMEAASLYSRASILAVVTAPMTNAFS